MTAFDAAPLTGILAQASTEDQQLLQQRLWQLLSRQALRYTMGESTSIPTQTGQALFSALCYTLEVALDAGQLPRSALLTCDLDQLLRQGQAALREKSAQTKRLWQRICAAGPPVENSYYDSTLQEIGLFFSRYNILFFADQIPCSVDYFLLQPIPETTVGVSYIAAYLQQLALEHEILGRMEGDLVVRVLESSVPDYRDMPLNLCEQPLNNALGRALLRRPVAPLDIRPNHREQLLKLLQSGAALDEQLENACQRVCSELRLEHPSLRLCVTRTAAALAQRMRAATDVRGLSGIFVSLLGADVCAGDAAWDDLPFD